MTTYYVTQAGSGTADGSSYANSMSVAGHNAGSFSGDDVIYLCDTITSSVDAPDSGTSGHPIIYRGDYASHAAIIDGSVLVDSWADDGDGTYSKASITKCHFFLEDTIPLPDATNATLADGNWYYDADGEILHYKPTSGVAGDHVTKRIILYGGLNLINLSYITVQNLSAQYCSKGIRSISVGVSVDTTTITKCRMGFYSEANAGHEAQAIDIKNSTITNCAIGILYHSDWVTTGQKHSGCTISGNTLIDIGYADGSSGTQWNDVIPGGTVQEGIVSQNLNTSTIEKNEIDGGASYGIRLHVQPDSNCKGNTIRQNYVHDNIRRAIRVAPHGDATECSGNSIYYNILENCGNSDPVVTGFVQLGNATVPAATYNYFYNNTIYNSNVGAIIGIWLDTQAQYWKVKNNIIAGCDVHLDVDNTSNHDIDYNLYDDDTGTKFDWGANSYNFADWKTNSGQDANSPAIADPLFVDASGNDFHLQAGSPCINAGTDPFSDGDGNKYDYDNMLVWDDSLDSPVDRWGDGVDIGAYGYFSEQSMQHLGLDLGL
jgi:hypothetical protein